MSLQIRKKEDLEFGVRILGVNCDGTRKTWVSMTGIPGIGRRISTLICKTTNIDPNKRAGFLSKEELEKFVSAAQNPLSYKIPVWFLNRRRDIKDGTNKHLASTQLSVAKREDIERMKRMRLHKGLRHYWLLKVRGQHTNATGRHGRTVAAARK
eukprot:Selendium_serpulae@DN2950_c0_g1_i1.p1